MFFLHFIWDEGIMGIAMRMKSIGIRLYFIKILVSISAQPPHICVMYINLNFSMQSYHTYSFSCWYSHRTEKLVKHPTYFFIINNDVTTAIPISFNQSLSLLVSRIQSVKRTSICVSFYRHNFLFHVTIFQSNSFGTGLLPIANSDINLLHSMFA